MNKILKNKFNKRSIRFYSENFNIFLKEIKNLSKWRNIPCSCTESHNIVKMAIFPKVIHRLNIEF